MWMMVCEPSRISMFFASDFVRLFLFEGEGDLKVVGGGGFVVVVVVAISGLGSERPAF
jgi:hypothetical protein